MARRLDDWIDSYLKYTENTEPRESYRTWAAISAIAAALQRKCYMPWGMETFHTNLYIVLVGPPAARKGTAMRPAKELLDRLGINLAADESSRQRLVKRLMDANAMHTDKEGITHIHSSLTIFATELTVFLGYNNTELLTIMCKWFDCEPRFIYETHARGVEEVSNVWVNLFGATTPAMIQSSMPTDTIGSGFASRTVFIFEENKEKIVIYPSLTPEQKQIRDNLLIDLGRIHTLCGRFRCEKEFVENYGIWRELTEAEPPFTDPRLAYYLQRRHVHLFKLCMAYSASRSNSLVVTKLDFDRAKKTLENAERKMSMTFKGMGANPLASIQIQVMRTIAEARTISFRKLMQIYYDDVDHNDLGKIIATLEAMRFCKMDIVKRQIIYIDENERNKE